MSIIYVLAPLALLLGGGFIAAFLWATQKGQFDDLDSPPVRILFDDLESGKKPEGHNSELDRPKQRKNKNLSRNEEHKGRPDE